MVESSYQQCYWKSDQPVCVRVCLCLYIYIYIYIYICVCVCVCVCTHIYLQYYNEYIFFVPVRFILKRIPPKNGCFSSFLVYYVRVSTYASKTLCEWASISSAMYSLLCRPSRGRVMGSIQTSSTNFVLLEDRYFDCNVIQSAQRNLIIFENNNFKFLKRKSNAML